MFSGISSFIAFVIFLVIVIFAVIRACIKPYLDIINSAPTLNEYIKKYPKMKTGNGIKCVVCGSKSIKIGVLKMLAMTVGYLFATIATPDYTEAGAGDSCSNAALIVRSRRSAP